MKTTRTHGSFWMAAALTVSACSNSEPMIVTQMERIWHGAVPDLNARPALSRWLLACDEQLCADALVFLATSPTCSPHVMDMCIDILLDAHVPQENPVWKVVFSCMEVAEFDVPESLDDWETTLRMLGPLQVLKTARVLRQRGLSSDAIRAGLSRWARYLPTGKVPLEEYPYKSFSLYPSGFDKRIGCVLMLLGGSGRQDWCDCLVLTQG